MSAGGRGETFAYRAFGLTIGSDLVLPELPSAAVSSRPDIDVRIRRGAVDAVLKDSVEVYEGVHARPGALLIDVETGRLLVRGGEEIIVDAAPGASERDVRLGVLGSAMGAICHQRGLLPLHANAVEIDGQAVAFAGPSGAGKSTLAAYFLQMGRKVLCDDLCVIGFDADGAPQVWPGICRIKLWDDALAQLGVDAAGLDRVWEGDDKFSLPTPLDIPQAPTPLTRIYALREAPDGAPATMVRLAGREAFEALSMNLFRPEFAEPLGSSQAQFRNIAALLRRSTVYSAYRQWGFEAFPQGGSGLVQHIRSNLT